MGPSDRRRSSEVAGRVEGRRRSGRDARCLLRDRSVFPNSRRRILRKELGVRETPSRPLETCGQYDDRRNYAPGRTGVISRCRVRSRLRHQSNVYGLKGQDTSSSTLRHHAQRFFSRAAYRTLLDEFDLKVCLSYRALFHGRLRHANSSPMPRANRSSIRRRNVRMVFRSVDETPSNQGKISFRQYPTSTS